MSTATDRPTKTLDLTQRIWLQEIGATLGVSLTSADDLVGGVDVKAADDTPAGADIVAANEQLLDFVCRVIVVNKTDIALRKVSDQLEPGFGRYQIRPPGGVPPHQEIAFTVLDKIRVKGTVTWAGDGI